MTAWRCAGASTVGSRHERAGQPGQDAFRVTTLAAADGEALVAVVADGAGSARCGGRGAELACTTFLREVERRGPPAADASCEVHLWCRDIVAAVRQCLQQEATGTGRPLADFATTLLGCVLTKRRAVFLQIGDGAMVYRCVGDVRWHPACRAVRGEYANETVFVTSACVPDSWRFHLVEGPVERVVLLTDGLERLALRLSDGTPHPPFFEFVSGLPGEGGGPGALLAFLASPPVVARTDDDATLVVAIRKEQHDRIPLR